MSTISDHKFLENHLAFLQSRLTKVGENSLLRKNISSHIEETEKNIADLSITDPEPKLMLRFYGSPVYGSSGVKASFTSKIFAATQRLINIDYAQRTSVGNKKKYLSESELFVTGVTHGSFGFQLEKLQNDSLFDSNDLSTTLNNVISLIENSTKDEGDFNNLLETSNFQLLGALKDFLQIIDKENAGAVIETGNLQYDLTAENAKIAYSRLSSSISDPEIVKVEGKFYWLPDSNKFQILSDSVDIIGIVSSEIEEGSLEPLLRSGGTVLGTCLKTSITDKTRKSKDIYELIKLELR